MRKYIVKMGSIARAVSDSLDEAKEPALELIRHGHDAYIDEMAVSLGQPTPVVTWRYHADIDDWVKSAA
jgi:hypothetical protein